jgi:hypothetical protein
MGHPVIAVIVAGILDVLLVAAAAVTDRLSHPLRHGRR